MPATKCRRWFAGTRTAARSTACRCDSSKAIWPEPETLPAALAEADVVVHAAAHVGDWGPAEKYRAINVVALEHMLYAAERHGPACSGGFKSARSACIRPATTIGTDETVPPDLTGLDGYTQTKAEAEMVIQRHIREHGLPAVILRPGFIYGPGDRHALAADRREDPSRQDEVPRPRRPVLNNTSVENLCDAILLAIEKPDILGETFNIRDERLVTREEFVNTVADYLGKPHPRHVPEWLGRLIVGPIEAIARLRGRETPPLLTRAQIKFLTLNLDFSIAKAKRLLGYRPRVDFRDGIVAALDDVTGSDSTACVRQSR